jgi:putative hydrolase of the HAD superfamily
MQAAHIGDSLTHDIAGARSVGIHSIWLNRKRLSSIDAPHVPDFEIETLHDLLQCLERVSVSAKLEARS